MKQIQNNICRSCRQKTTLEMHHRVAQRNGGSNSPVNAVGLCESCHEEWDRLSYQGELFPLELIPFYNAES